eukprot:TRINITY_DN508_c0_g2_i1.p1 TRINITY_DN508_c0_g2~~TRINITY_DN508_c0_g2_i1.p1  ORF type:complete len:339 (+),score=109.82 TRINITY_DN508_c0_g2_i1:681-1697(+)
MSSVINIENVEPEDEEPVRKRPRLPSSSSTLRLRLPAPLPAIEEPISDTIQNSSQFHIKLKIPTYDWRSKMKNIISSHQERTKSRESEMQQDKEKTKEEEKRRETQRERAEEARRERAEEARREKAEMREKAREEEREEREREEREKEREEKENREREREKREKDRREERLNREEERARKEEEERKRKEEEQVGRTLENTDFLFLNEFDLSVLATVDAKLLGSTMPYTSSGSIQNESEYKLFKCEYEKRRELHQLLWNVMQVNERDFRRLERIWMDARSSKDIKKRELQSKTEEHLYNTYNTRHDILIKMAARYTELHKECSSLRTALEQFVEDWSTH